MSEPINAFDALKTRVLNVRGMAYVFLFFVASWTAIQFTGNVLDFFERFQSKGSIESAQGKLRPLYFEFSGTGLLDESRERIKTYAAIIKSVSPKRIVVEGYNR